MTKLRTRLRNRMRTRLRLRKRPKMTKFLKVQGWLLKVHGRFL